MSDDADYMDNWTALEHHFADLRAEYRLPFPWNLIMRVLGWIFR